MLEEATCNPSLFQNSGVCFDTSKLLLFQPEEALYPYFSLSDATHHYFIWRKYLNGWGREILSDAIANINMEPHTCVCFMLIHVDTYVVGE